MTPRRIPQVLVDRIPYEREECLGLHFSSGTSRDAAREFWELLEETFGVDLRGLHPDDELGQILHPGDAMNTAALGSFRHCASMFAGCRNTLAKVEFVMSLEEAVNERRGRGAGPSP